MEHLQGAVGPWGGRPCTGSWRPQRMQSSSQLWAAAAANGSKLQAPRVAHSGANYHHWLACATALAPTYPTQASAAAHLDSEQDQFVQVVRRAKPAPCRAVARYRWHDWRRWPYTPASRGLCARLATVPLLAAAQVAGGEFVVGCRKFYISGWNQ